MEVQNRVAGPLRNKLSEDQNCLSRFAEAMALWESLYEKDTDKYHLPSLFEGHGREHFQQIELLLDKMIFVEWGDPKNFIPSPQEALLLLSAVWLHDIGLLNGIFASDPSVEEIDVQVLVSTYHERTARFLRERWKDWCNWSQFHKNLLGEICLCHRPGRSIDDLKYETHGVHVRKLAALLRVADVCHMSADRMPVDLARWVDPTFQNGTGAELEILAKPQSWVHSVELDRATQSLVLFTQLPKPKDIPAIADIQLPAGSYLPAVTLNFRPFTEYLCDGLQSVLNEVSAVLVECPNCAFRYVRLQFEFYDAMGTAEEHVVDMWPSLLAGTRCGGEAASMVAVILRSLIIREGTGVPKNILLHVLNCATRLHTWNALVQRLNDEMQTRLNGMTALQGEELSTTRDAILEYLTRFLNERVNACQSVAEMARPIIDDVDVVVIYGYSKTVLATLSRTTRRFSGQVLAVSVDQVPNNRWVKYDDDRVRAEMEKAKIPFDFVDSLTLATRLQWLKREGKRIKVLLGTKAVLPGGDVVALGGNRTVAALARDASIPVIVLAEDEKAKIDATRHSAIRMAVEVSQNPQVVSERVELLSKDKHYDKLVGAVAVDIPQAVPDLPAQVGQADLPDSPARKKRHH